MRLQTKTIHCRVDQDSSSNYIITEPYRTFTFRRDLFDDLDRAMRSVTVTAPGAAACTGGY